MVTTQATATTSDDPWGGCNPLDPAFRADPYPGLARLRERDPVNQTPIGIWRLTRYADVVELLKCGVSASSVARHLGRAWPELLPRFRTLAERARAERRARPRRGPGRFGRSRPR